jgi:hypothetical protein
MTCSELYAYFASDPRAALKFAQDSAEVLEHIGRCAECDRFVQEQQVLAKCLQLVRDGVPAIPASLHASVLARYRTYISERPQPAASLALAGRISLRGGFGRAAAAAFAVVVTCGAIFFFSPGRRNGAHQRSGEQRPAVNSQVTTSMNKVMAGALKVVRTKQKSVPAVRHAKSRGSVRIPPTSDQRDKSSATRFQSLMYCDQLSCPGAMEVIRVQLTSPVLGLSSVSSKPGDFVYADVLVGPDGIARGIRVVE